MCFFAWMAAFIAAVWLIGFIPAIAVFVFAYMALGFGEPALPSLGYAAATTVLCWVVFHWALSVAWPQSLLGDLFPQLRAATGLIGLWLFEESYTQDFDEWFDRGTPAHDKVMVREWLLSGSSARGFRPVPQEDGRVSIVGWIAIVRGVKPQE